ncbi:MAG: hypothetical protein JOY82_22380 [Streptosporangiaceae bacterium]|nr:hypothetical protein [Streptosporangiaceae bacterium]MBV9857232.1 hypothetical protein [Streptosporangiaceae bacterium]
MARRLRQVIGDMNYAQQRLIARLLSYDLQLGQPDAAPATYAEFLLRTSGPLLREPSARERC